MVLPLSDGTQAAIRTAQRLAEDGDVPAALGVFDALLENLVEDHREATAVLHVRALVVDDPAEKLWTNEAALHRAELAGLPDAQRATLHANVGSSHHALGNLVEARRWYERALAAAGTDDVSLRQGVEEQLARLR
ncbi:MAG TPA: hypothetical protein VEA78_04110 [Acidimicrobiales bacterium]|nr:hypothetical protein [Acidimicrobiales bacterium]